MDRQKLVDILNSEEFTITWEGCNALQGLNIIDSYLPGKGIVAANHDIIYSVTVDALVGAGINKEDVVKLRELNWMTEDDSLACFV